MLTVTRGWLRRVSGVFACAPGHPDPRHAAAAPSRRRVDLRGAARARGRRVDARAPGPAGRCGSGGRRRIRTGLRTTPATTAGSGRRVGHATPRAGVLVGPGRNPRPVTPRDGATRVAATTGYES
ncbi:MAG: hypothetical protein EOP32_02680 [Rhodococcus sp. (in: high G+C Gram-positive bacteria)]|nr:MAG: hypothetical protein EOP32_02680 [Rhodococcus sp. (in: high G+C Gram-positive bacteria)]